MADFGGTELDTFTAEASAWLEDNYPPELRSAEAATDPEAVWGGRAFAGSDDPQIVWMRRMASRGWTAPTWPSQYGGGGLNPDQARALDKLLTDGNTASRWRRSASGCWDRCCSNTARRRRSANICPRSSPAISAGARAIPSRAPVRTSPRCRPNARTPAITG